MGGDGALFPPLVRTIWFCLWVLFALLVVGWVACSDLQRPPDRRAITCYNADGYPGWQGPAYLKPVGCITTKPG